MSLDVAKAVVQLNSLTAKFDTGAQSVTPFYPNIATVFPSKVRSEDYGWLGAFPGVREWIGERKFNELRAARYQLVNKLWETSVNIDREDIEDDRLGIYGPVLEGVGSEAAQHPDELMFSILTTGASSLCFDGQFFFDTDHAWGDSGTQSNALTPSAASTSAPTAAEWKTSFNNALLAMMAFKNDQGKLLNRPILSPDNGLIAIVPPGQWQAARDAMEAVVLSSSQNIALSMPKIIASPYLTLGTRWYLLKTDGILKPFIFQARRPLQRQMKGLDDREFRAVKFMADARYNAGYLAWWCAIQSTFI